MLFNASLESASSSDALNNPILVYFFTSGQFRKAQLCPYSTESTSGSISAFHQCNLALDSSWCLWMLWSGGRRVTRRLCGPRLLLDFMLFTEELQECPTNRPNGSCSTEMLCCHWLIWRPAVRKPPLPFTLALRSSTTVVQLPPIVAPLGRRHTDSPRDIQFELHCVKTTFQHNGTLLG